MCHRKEKNFRLLLCFIVFDDMRPVVFCLGLPHMMQEESDPVTR
jgi:hypothetical protein